MILFKKKNVFNKIPICLLIKILIVINVIIINNNLFILKINEKGSSFIARVCEQLDLVEKDYFGLRYVDNKRQRVCNFYNYLS